MYFFQEKKKFDCAYITKIEKKPKLMNLIIYIYIISHFYFFIFIITYLFWIICIIYITIIEFTQFLYNFYIFKYKNMYNYSNLTIVFI